MITTVFLNLIFALISYFISLLPAGVVFPTAWTAGIATIWGDINAFSFIVPVDTLLTCLVIAIIFHLFQFGWNFMHWIYGIIRGSRFH